MTRLRTVSKHPEQLETTPLIAESHHYDDPLAPQKLIFLEAVNQQRCVINSPQRNSQLTNTIPFFIVLLVMAFYTLFGFVDNHIATKNSIEIMAKHVEEKYGHKKEQNMLSAKLIELYKPYFGKDKISLWEYIKAYDSGNFVIDGQYDKYLILGWLIFFPGFLWLFGYLSFFTPPVYLIADKQRGILYSYGMGKVRLTRYKEAQFGYAGNMLAIKLYGINEKTGQLKTILYRPNVSHYSSFLTSTDSENHRFITFLNAYMQQGRDAVSPVDYQARKPFLSFGKNPLPADFEQQVKQILAKLDQEKKTMRKIDKEGTE
ncbi:hypothetical protein R2242_05965 [Proteus mirabilis]|uniref:hypothetical protein n=14 Tax=Proteus mirabilis TaxID=584 RepID=UPI0006B30D0B|nr:hypothetical protein [Proteus mirabilis]SSJ82991.1 Uncharacterised protein [Klebsiella pneumoniae]ALE21330.1 hypothetical protein AOC00_03140 [Proteus mirabilis]ALE24452.1 hypothetical protein AOB99_03145 [Proteus mirabilis]AND14273.1 hypothetical protein AOUC001_15815 [Proteus mirabilis]ATC73477.1 hypothetical protein BG257_02130 [Proteus mirabilis]